MSNSSSDQYYLDQVVDALDNLGDIEDYDASRWANDLREWCVNGGDKVNETIATVSVTMHVPWDRSMGGPRGPVQIEISDVGSPEVTDDDGNDVAEDAAQCVYWKDWVRKLYHGEVKPDVDFV